MRTLLADGFSLRLMFRVKECPVFAACKRAWCRSLSRQPPLKHVKQTSIPRGLSCEAPLSREQSATPPERSHLVVEALGTLFSVH